MTKYSVNVSVAIYAMPDDPIRAPASSSNSLYHGQTFEIEGKRFGDIAPTIDGIYAAIHRVVEAEKIHARMEELDAKRD